MADATFTIGSTATCSDGPCGKVTKVVVDPVARTLTHLVIEPEHRSGLGRLVPLDRVTAGPDGVEVHCTVGEFDALPQAEENDFLPGGSGYEDYEAHEAYYWPYFGIEGAAEPLVANASAIVTHDTLPPGEVGIRRGDRVHASDGEIGRVEGLVVDARTGRVSHVLLQEGHLWGRKDVAIPIASVERMAEGITVHMSKHEIGELPAVDLVNPG